MEKDRQMKDVAMPIIKNRVKLLLCNANFATLLKQNGELAFEVLCESVGHKDRIDASIESEGFEYYCHYCGEHYYRDDDTFDKCQECGCTMFIDHYILTPTPRPNEERTEWAQEAWEKIQAERAAEDAARKR